MVSTRPTTSKPSSPFNNSIVTVPKVPITIGIIVTFMFHSFFNSLARSRYLSLFSHSFSFVLWSAETGKSTILQIFSFFVDYYKVWSSDRELVIRLYIKVPQEFVHIIFLDRCWVVHIPFVGMVKFKFLAHFPVDHLAHPVVSSLVPLLCPYKFFTPVFAGRLSLKSEWQQFSSCLQDFSQYSSRSQQCCSLDGFDSLTDF